MEAAVSTEIARPLHVLVPLIKEDLKQAKTAVDEAGKPYYRAAGEKLIEAQDSGKMTDKELAAWSKRHFKIGQSQTFLYMDYADATSHLSSREKHPSLHSHRKKRGLRQNVYPKPWHDDVNEEVKKANIDTWKQDALAKAQERMLQRKMALTLINIGYKVLATQLHPDKKGGSVEGMRRLNAVRAILKDAVTI